MGGCWRAGGHFGGAAGGLGVALGGAGSCFGGSPPQDLTCSVGVGGCLIPQDPQILLQQIQAAAETLHPSKNPEEVKGLGGVHSEPY